jgi:hypothetical protein
MQCRTAWRPGLQSFKDSILETCDQRNDQLSSDVRVRVSGAQADLHAADAQYHKDCHARFFSARNVKAAKTSAIFGSDGNCCNETLVKLVETMNNDPSHMWSTSELYNVYTDLEDQDTPLGKRQLISILKEHLGEKLIEMKIDGCASLLCLRSHLKANLVESHESEDMINYSNKLIKHITKEAKGLPKQTDYDLGQFTTAKTVENTSETLLYLITNLVSSGELSTEAISLAQSIQSHITKTSKQTTLGLAVKLHHRFGSKELVSTLHEYGYICTYGEVLRFRTSVAKYIGDRDYTARGLDVNGRHIGSWCDNYDLKVSTPNGMRETHAMVIEWRQQQGQPAQLTSQQDQPRQLTPQQDHSDQGTPHENQISLLLQQPSQRATVIEPPQRTTVIQQPRQQHMSQPETVTHEVLSTSELETSQECLLTDQGLVDMSEPERTEESFIIPRLSRNDMKGLKLSELAPVTMLHYQGPNKVNPPNVDLHTGPSYDTICHTMESITKALAADTEWIVTLIKGDEDETPGVEWSGYMAARAREQSSNVLKATRYIFGPLIDATPSHPDTVLTTLTLIEEFVKNHGQKYIFVEADMQIYKIAINIKWSNPTRWAYLIVRPGGMHTLMSFVGCVGVLMQGTGLETILNAAFNGVGNMLNGKAWPKALRGLRMVVAVLLEDVVKAGNTSPEAIQEALEEARKSPTGRLWVDCLIMPVIIAHLFLRAERTGDWRLHLYCIKRMICYLWAAGHWFYAKYLLWHLIEMEHLLDEEAESMFLSGDHVCRHTDGSWNSVFSDQFGEQTYIRYGKSKGGLVGLTLSQDQVAGWVLSQHVCNYVSLLMDKMLSETDQDETQKPHTEEGKHRKRLDANDRSKLREQFEAHSNPLTSTADRLVNVMNGCIASDKVNVVDAVAIGQEMAANFQEGLPDAFHKPVRARVHTMEIMQKGVKVGDQTIYNIEKLYGRLLVISSKRNLPLDYVFAYELAPLPSALFDEYGLMRKSSKSTLVSKSKLFVVCEDDVPVDLQLVDGNELIYHTIWPKMGTTLALCHSLTKAAEQNYPVYVIFDKYSVNSIKSQERERRKQRVAYPDYELSINTTLQARDTIMKNSNNKRQIINIICAHGESEKTHMIGEEQTLFQHEEADVSIISYLFHLIRSTDVRHVQVRCDDTDILLLLLHYYWTQKPGVRITMKKFDNKVFDIGATAARFGNKCSNLLAMHALTGCDTTSYPFQKGKTTGLNILMKHDNLGLECFGEEGTTKEEIIEVGSRYFSYLYGATTQKTMNFLRHKNFVSSKTTPAIKTLPPTDEALKQHLLRCHLQVRIWKAALTDQPPTVDISSWGWEIVDGTPQPVTGVKQVAPPDLLKVVACDCRINRPCSRNSCSCKSAGLSCTSFCKCHADAVCQNEHTKHEEEFESDSDAEDTV